MTEKQSTLSQFFTKTPKICTSNDVVSKDLVENSNSEIPVSNDNEVMHIDISSNVKHKLEDKDISDVKSKKKRKFNPSWEKDFDWILFDKASNTVSCKYCRKLLGNGADPKWIKGFSASFKKETFAFHDKSRVHKAAVEQLKTKAALNESPMAKCIKKMDKEIFSHMEKLFNISYYIAKHDKPFADFEDLLSLATKLEVKMLGKYCNEMECRIFVHYIAEMLRSQLEVKFKKSQFISIMIDGSTDRTTMEHAMVYVRYIENGIIMEDFLGVIDLISATSEGYFIALTDLINKRIGAENYKDKMYIVGLGTDGAASMVGHKSGLCVRMKEVCVNLISIHCIAHRLQLAILDACKTIDYIQSFENTVKCVCKFYSGSAKRLHKLQETSKALGEKLFKLGDIHSVRWIASREKVLQALCDSWKAVVDLEQSVVNNDPDASKTKGLLKLLKQFQFVKLLHFLLDFYGMLKPLSISLQSSHLMLPALKGKCEQALHSLSKLENAAGLREQQFLENASLSGMFKDIQLANINAGEKNFQIIKEKLISYSKSHLRSRLESLSNDLIQSMHIFDSLQWPPRGDLLNYGLHEIETLGKHIYSNDWHNKSNLLLAEWAEYKLTTSSLNFQEALKRINENPDRFPTLLPVANYIAVLPPSTAACERGFSAFNRIKTAFRNALSTNTMDDLLTISINGPDIQNFNPDDAIDKWYFSADRQRYTNSY